MVGADERLVQPVALLDGGPQLEGRFKDALTALPVVVILNAGLGALVPAAEVIQRLHQLQLGVEELLQRGVRLSGMPEIRP